MEKQANLKDKVASIYLYYSFINHINLFMKNEEAKAKFHLVGNEQDFHVGGVFVLHYLDPGLRVLAKQARVSGA